MPSKCKMNVLQAIPVELTGILRKYILELFLKCLVFINWFSLFFFFFFFFPLFLIVIQDILEYL